MTNVPFLRKLRISRDINPSPAIQNFRNLNEEVYLLGAIGSLSGKCLNVFARIIIEKLIVEKFYSGALISSLSRCNHWTTFWRGQAVFDFKNNCDASWKLRVLISLVLSSRLNFTFIKWKPISESSSFNFSSSYSNQLNKHTYMQWICICHEG